MNNLDHPFLLLILIAYLSANGLCLLAYWPQLRAVFTDPVARCKIVPFTWWIWTLGGATECLYAFFGVHQLVWAVVAFIHMLACSVIACMGTWHSHRLAWSVSPSTLTGLSPLSGSTSVSKLVD